MTYTLAIISFWGILYGLLKYDFKSPKIKKAIRKLKLLFCLHCRRTINSDYKYSLKSVGVVLGIIMICLLAISKLFETINLGSEKHVIAIGKEMAALFFMLYLGAKSMNTFKSETRVALLGCLKILVIAFIIYNTALFFSIDLSVISLKEIQSLELLFLLIFGGVTLVLFLYLKAIPFICFNSLTFSYRKIIIRCYKKHSQNPISHFFRYIGVLVFFVGLIHDIIWLLLE